MEQWNNVELANLSKKSYTLNHEFDLKKRNSDAGDVNSASNNNNTNGSESSNNVNAANESTENSNKSEILKPGSNIKPQVSVQDVESIVRRLYGITIGELKEMISYDDKNYLIKEDSNIKNPIIATHWPHGYVLKILNALDSQKTDFVDAQNELMIYLSKQNIPCPRPIANVNQKYFSIETIKDSQHIVRLLEYLPGKIFHEVEVTNNLLFQSGEFLAKINQALKNFQHSAYETHKSLWMLHSVPQLRDFLYAVKDESRVSMVEEIIEAFEKNVLCKVDTFETQIIHGDYNEQNIVVDADGGTNAYKVTAIIDFGDTNKSPIIFEVGIALTYMLLQAQSVESGGVFLSGYNSVRPIKPEEKEYLKYCVVARLAQSLVMGAYTHSVDSSNDYVLVTQERGWKMIEKLWKEEFNNIDEIWQKSGDTYLTQSTK